MRPPRPELAHLVSSSCGTLQVVLFNLLIGIMSNTLARVSAHSRLVAKCERARVILEQEELRFGSNKKHINLAKRLGIDHVAAWEQANMQGGEDKYNPHWLHVLLPPGTSADNAGEGRRACGARVASPIESCLRVSL